MIMPGGAQGDGLACMSEANPQLTKVNRLFSAGRASGTHASTAVKDSLLGGMQSNKQLDHALAASNYGERRLG